MTIQSPIAEFSPFDLDDPDNQEFLILVLESLVRDFLPLWKMEPKPGLDEDFDLLLKKAEADALYGHFGQPLAATALSELLIFKIVDGLDATANTWDGIGIPAIFKLRVSLADIRSHVLANKSHFPIAPQGCDNVFAGLIISADWLGRFPTTRNLLPADRFKHYEAVVPHLERFGYLKRNCLSADYFWTDAAGRAMLRAGAWNEAGKAVIDIDTDSATKMLNLTPRALVQQDITAETRSELMKLIRDHFDEQSKMIKLIGISHHYRDFYLIDLLWPIFNQEKAYFTELKEHINNTLKFESDHVVFLDETTTPLKAPLKKHSMSVIFSIVIALIMIFELVISKTHQIPDTVGFTIPAPTDRANTSLRDPFGMQQLPRPSRSSDPNCLNGQPPQPALQTGLLTQIPVICPDH